MARSKNSRSRSKSKRRGSKGKKQGAKRGTKKRTKSAKGSSKAIRSIMSNSPYDSLGVRSGKGLNNQSTAPTLNKLELFGSYKPMNPMSTYAADGKYPFAPGSNASGFLSKDNSLKQFDNKFDDPLMEIFLNINKQTNILTDSQLSGDKTNLNVQDTYTPVLTNEYPYMKDAPATTAPTATAPAAKSGGALNAIFGGSSNMTYSLENKTIDAPKRVTLDDITYRVDVNSQGEADYIRNRPLMIVHDEKGINKDQQYLIAHKNY